MKKQLIAVYGVALACCLGVMLSASPAMGATDKPKKAASAKQKRGSTKFVPGSQETKKERSARLQRECKGQVNAGACSGYAQ